MTSTATTKTKDLRHRRTESSLRRAFFDVLATTPFEQLTITNLVSAAQIGRPTFYQHYVDKYALADAIIGEFATAFDNVIATRFDHADIFGDLDRLSAYLTTARAEITLLQQIHLPRNPTLLKRYHTLLQSRFCQHYASNAAADVATYLGDLYAAVAGVFIRRVLADDHPSPAALAKINEVQQLILAHL